MFKLQPNPTFTSKVTISVPGGKAVQVGIVFRHLSRNTLKDYFAGLKGRADEDALADIIAGWEGIDAPYSAENLATLVDNYPCAAMELFDAFRRDLLEAARKN